MQLAKWCVFYSSYSLTISTTVAIPELGVVLYSFYFMTYLHLKVPASNPETV